MKPASLAVIKVGGSLFDWPLLPARLTVFLDAIEERGRGDRPVLIAGGGLAVDAIRTLDEIHRLGDDTAHQLAMRALDLTAMILAALVPGSIVIDRIESLTEVWKASSIPILSPRRVLADIELAHHNALPASWEVTSDTIAARVAVHLEAECLILLKSAPWPASSNSHDASSTLEDAARLGLVDSMLPAAARSLLRVEYLNLRGPSLEPRLLLP